MINPGMWITFTLFTPHPHRDSHKDTQVQGMDGVCFSLAPDDMQIRWCLISWQIVIQVMSRKWQIVVLFFVLLFLLLLNKARLFAILLRGLCCRVFVVVVLYLLLLLLLFWLSDMFISSRVAEAGKDYVQHSCKLNTYVASISVWTPGGAAWFSASTPAQRAATRIRKEYWDTYHVLVRWWVKLLVW